MHHIKKNIEESARSAPSYKGKVSSSDGESYRLTFLEPIQVSMVDEALASLGDYGEVRLVIEKGRLRFLVTQKSFDAMRWQPSSSLG